MHPFPHLYTVSAAAVASGDVQLRAEGLPALSSAPPVEFDGPGNQWSPETLLCAAVADCFILGFRAYARASKLDWTSLECRTEGKLERIEGVSRFTTFTTHATLRVPPGSDAAKARTLLDKAERGCLIANSLSAQRHLEAEVSS